MATITPEQQVIIDKAKEYQALVGKTYQASNGPLDQIFTVTKYLGVLRHNDGVKYHTLEIEITPGKHRWTPAASKFLADHSPVDIKPETATDEVK
jgi:hypothetical protein